MEKLFVTHLFGASPGKRKWIIWLAAAPVTRRDEFLMAFGTRFCFSNTAVEGALHVITDWRISRQDNQYQTQKTTLTNFSIFLDYKLKTFRKCLILCNKITFLITSLSDSNSEIHSVWVYKKNLYKKRLVEFLKIKKRQLVDFFGLKKRWMKILAKRHK